jgi:hypothetical protein
VKGGLKNQAAHCFAFAELIRFSSIRHLFQVNNHAWEQIVNM